MTSPMWVAVDELTMPTKRRVEHDDGTVTWAEVPSLWDQSTDALETGMAGGGSGSTLRERSPLDVTLMEIRSIITGTVRHELAARRIYPRGLRLGYVPPFQPIEIRHLASAVLSNPDELWWYEYRFASWARLLGTYLRAYDRTPGAVHLRNTPCPTCGVAQVSDEDGMVTPAILIDFHDGLVRAAQCCHCGALWWRGPQLENLAALLHTQAA